MEIFGYLAGNRHFGRDLGMPALLPPYWNSIGCGVAGSFSCVLLLIIIILIGLFIGRGGYPYQRLIWRILVSFGCCDVWVVFFFFMRASGPFVLGKNSLVLFFWSSFLFAGLILSFFPGFIGGDFFWAAVFHCSFLTIAKPREFISCPGK